MVDQVSIWAIGKSESELRRVLGAPDWTGIGGILGVKWQPSDGSEAWNYSMAVARDTSHLHKALSLYVKEGRVLKAEQHTVGCGDY